MILLIWEFVIFQKRIIRGRRPIYLFPPVDFPELSRLKGIRDVVSSSPCPFTDMAIRRHYGYGENVHQTGTLLIGFNS